jgi:ATP-binding cassette subfamily B protein
MSGKKQGDKTRALRNTVYSLKLMYKINKASLFNGFLTYTFSYFGWVFYSVFFIRYLVGAIERSADFKTILAFILITGTFFMLMGYYDSYFSGTFNPISSAKIYYKLYGMLYKKACNIELSCFEDSSFYNKYTLAIDKAEEKLATLVYNIFGIIIGAIAAAIVFASMFRIDKIAVLFVIFPIIGNFVFGYLVNKFTYKRDQAMVPYKRRIEYINRVMHLADYSKEMRLSRVYNLMKEKYLKAISSLFEVVEQYVLKINLPLWFRNYFTFTIIFEGVLLYGAYRTIVSKTMMLSELAVLSSAMVSATWILIGFTENIMETIKQSIFIENLRTFMEYEERLPEDSDGLYRIHT